MQPVIESLQRIPEADVRAIATYLASFEGPRDQATREKQTKDALSFAQQRVFKVPELDGANTTSGAGSPSNSDGAIIFAGACATCHHESGRLPVSRPIPLALSSTVNDASPTNFARIVLDGIHPPAGASGPIMPGFAGALTDQQIVALANFVRQQFSQNPAWQNIDKALTNKSPQRAAAGGAQ
jgi:mono/diheme cytochrome c family protein